jgi:hypothetical protein
MHGVKVIRQVLERTPAKRLNIRMLARRAIDYSLKHREVFARFFDNGRPRMRNNAARRELRTAAVGRRNWTSHAPTNAAAEPPPSTG